MMQVESHHPHAWPLYGAVWLSGPIHSTRPARSPVPNTAFVLPKTQASPGQPAREAEEDTTHTLSPDTGQVLVLVAEDEETIAETLALIVEDAGYVALVAHDGREALALSRQHHPHLIITDLMMPYLSGADFIAAVRSDATARGYAPPPVIVVTATSRARAEEAGADAIVTKPFDIAKIEAAMQRLLQEQAD